MVQLRARSLIAAFFLSVQIFAQSAPVPASSSAQQSSAQQQQKLVSETATVLKVTTHLVVVDVVAGDKHGQPVTDLNAGDFTVLEDGKRQEIHVFNFRRPQLNAAASAPRKSLQLPPNVFTNIPTYSQNNSLNIILLDLVNTDVANQAYARQQILKYLAGIPDGEPMAVAVYTLGRKVRLVQDFTSDFAALRNSLNRIKGERSPVLENLAAGISPDVKDTLSPPPSVLGEFAKVYEGSEQLDRRLEYTLDGLASLARALSGYPGRKNLIWVSAAFPLGVIPDPSLGRNEFASVTSYEQAVISVSQALVDAQVAVYPVDPRGPILTSMYGGHGAAGNQVGTLQAEAGAGDDEHETMKRVAQLTGGKAYYNQNDLDDAIRGSIADGSTYYTLAYYPDNKDWNGKFRKIEVRVDRPEIKVRHRPGYYALKPRNTDDPKELFTAFGRALKLESPISTGLRFEAGVIPPSEKTLNKVLLNFALDPHAVSFEMQEDGLQHATVHCAVQAYTENGRLIKTDGNTLSTALDPPTFTKAMQSFLLARVTIDLPPGSYLLRLGVMDEHTGLIGTTNAKVTVVSSAGALENKTGGKKP